MVKGSCGLFGLLLVSCCTALCGCSATPATSAQNYAGREELARHRILRKHYQADSTRTRGIWFLSPSVVFEDKTGRCWVGSALGIYTYTEDTNEWRALTNGGESTSFVRAINEDPSGTIWVVSGAEPRIRYLYGGRWREASEVHAPSAFSLRGVMFNGLRGQLWFLSDRGLISFDGHQWSAPLPISDTTELVYLRMRRRLPNDELSQALAAVDKLINQKELPQGHEASGNQNGSAMLEEITSGLQDHDGDLWLCAERGILRFDRKKSGWKMYTLPDILIEASRAYEDRKARLWFADDWGNLSVYDKKRDTWKSYALPDLRLADDGDAKTGSRSVEAIYQDQHGQMMFATQLGLVILSESETKWQVLTTQNSSLPDNRITSITEDRKGRIWIGTGAGILLLEE